MAKKKHHNKSKKKAQSELDEDFNLIYNPKEDRDWADWVVENNIRFTSDVTLEDYQILRRLLLRGSGYVLNDIAKAPEDSSAPDFFGNGLSMNEYRWYRGYDDERKYTLDYRSRKRYIANYSQYIQRREVTNLDKFQVPLDSEHLKRMALFYGIQLFDDIGNMVFAALLYTCPFEQYILVKQWFLDPSKRIPVTNIIPRDAVLRSNTVVYGCDYPRFTRLTKTDGLFIRPFTTAEGDFIAVIEK